MSRGKKETATENDASSHFFEPASEKQHYGKLIEVTHGVAPGVTSAMRGSARAGAWAMLFAVDREPPEDRRIYSPSDVAGRLGVSSSGLRRLALIYERVHGELPRDPKLGRVWPPEAIERLEGARNTVRSGRSVSVEQALSAGEASDGVQVPRIPSRPAMGDLAALVEELGGLREAVEEQNRIMQETVERLEALEALERENRELRASPPAPVDPVPSTGQVRIPEPVAQRPRRPGLFGRVRAWIRTG